MRVLFDHNVSRRLRHLLPEHEVQTASECGWSAFENGRLLAAAEAASFEVLVTADQNMIYQQNNDLRKIALVVLSSNRRRPVEEQPDALRQAVARALPGSYEFIDVADRSNQVGDQWS